MCKWELTLRVLAVSSVKGGVAPDNTKMSENPNRILVPRMIVLIAPRHQ